MAGARGRIAGWVARYLPLELLGTASAIAGAWVSFEASGSLIVAAVVGTIAEGVGYYALALARAGQLHEARRMAAVAVQIAQKSGRRERAGLFESATAVWEAIYGNAAAAKRSATRALELGRGGREVEYAAAFAVALAGDLPQSRALAGILAREFPEDTSVQSMYLPALRALFSLNAPSPDAAAAIQALQTASRYDLALAGLDHDVRADLRVGADVLAPHGDAVEPRLDDGVVVDGDLVTRDVLRCADHVHAVATPGTGGSRIHRHVVEEAEPHGRFPGGMVAGGTDIAEGPIAFPAEHHVHGPHHRAGGMAGGMQRGRVHHGVRIDAHMALQRRVRLDAVHVDQRNMHEAINLGIDNGQSRFSDSQSR